MSEDIRIGVFVCDCGSNIASVVNVPEVVEYASTLPSVVHCEEGRWSCSVDALGSLQESIQSQELNRVVIACCTPRTHEPIFKRAVKDAGLNPYLLEFVSIREHVSWVHMNEPEKATEKAKDLVKMGAAKAALLEEGEEIRLPVSTDCLIIGGGIAGMTAALNVAQQGFQATIVEREDQLGGIVNSINSISHNGETLNPKEYLDKLRSQIEDNSYINVFTNTQINSISGYIGNYDISLVKDSEEKRFQVSTIITATGMEEITPPEGFLYGQDQRVITQFQLEKEIQIQDFNNKESVVFVQCVGSRNEERGCCSIGCKNSLKNACLIKSKSPETEVIILHRELNLVKSERSYVEKARQLGVQLFQFTEEKYPQITSSDDKLQIAVYDSIIQRQVLLQADLIVLSVGFCGHQSVSDLKGLLKVSTNKDDFWQESHVKLGPVDFASEGLYLCGCARYPKDVKDSIDEAMAASMRASIPMKNGYIEAEGIVASIDLDNCNQCSICWKRCPYGAIDVDNEGNPHVIQGLCKGCGLCAADCPKKCITIVHFSDEQIMAQIEAALEEDPEEKIITFVCHWCALGGLDMAGVSRLQYPTPARVIRVMCSARVSIDFIERAFELGAAGVLVAGCEFPTCHYITGNYAAEKRINRCKRILSKKGYDPDRLWNIWCSAADAPKMARTMREMAESLSLT